MTTIDEMQLAVTEHYQQTCCACESWSLDDGARGWCVLHDRYERADGTCKAFMCCTGGALIDMFRAMEA